MNGIYLVTAALALASALCVLGATRAKDNETTVIAVIAAFVFGGLLLCMLVGSWRLAVHEACRGEPDCPVQIGSDPSE